MALHIAAIGAGTLNPYPTTVLSGLPPHSLTISITLRAGSLIAEAAIWLPKPSRMMNFAFLVTSSGMASYFKAWTNSANLKVKPSKAAAVSVFIVMTCSKKSI